MTMDAIGAAIGRSCASICMKARMLGLKRPKPKSKRAWVQADMEYLKATYADPTNRLADIAQHCGKSVVTVCKVARSLGLSRPLGQTSRWTEEKIESVRAYYAAPCSTGLVDFARSIGYSSHAVAEKAKTLGLALTEEDRALMVSVRVKKLFAERGHPRGMLGKTKSEESRARSGAGIRRAWADPASKFNSPEFRQRRADANARRPLDRSGGMFSRCAGGVRADLGATSFRSAWEANYARHLNQLVIRSEIASWQYETRTFRFDEIRIGRGRSYTPDFEVLFHDGHVEWHEVKGWMDAASRLKLDRMAKFYPDVIVRVVGKEWFRAAEAPGGRAPTIDGWEWTACPRRRKDVAA